MPLVSLGHVGDHKSQCTLFQVFSSYDAFKQVVTCVRMQAALGIWTLL